MVGDQTTTPSRDRPLRFISIDDHPLVSDAMSRAAAEWDDVEMLRAFRSIEAVPRPYRSTGEVDAILLDLSLPGLGGVEGVSAVSAWGPPVLVYSASSQERIAKEVLRAGAVGFVAKSQLTAEVIDALRRVVRGEQVVLGTEVSTSPKVSLTPAEEDLMRKLSRETRSSELAALTGVTPAVVNNRMTVLYDKLGLRGAERTRTRLSRWAEEQGYT